MVLVLVGLVGLLALLNAATYVQKEKVPDSELSPNRSTYNPGSTGTHAFYTLLSETGHNVTRWQTSLDDIADQVSGRPAVFVMIGPLQRQLSDAENTALMKWVSMGGTLVLIDREPSRQLAMSTTQWEIAVRPAADSDLFAVDASDQRQMTASTAAHKPVQPTRFSYGVHAVQPSRFASSVELQRFAGPTYDARKLPKDPALQDPGMSPTPEPTHDFYSADHPPPPASHTDGYGSDTEEGAEPDSSPPPDGETGEELKDEDALTFAAPMVHVAGGGTNLVIEAPFAEGRVVVVSDPYVVSNAGINLVDNARLGINIVASGGGLIAFDEFHHGYGANNNRLLDYFRGTPVVAIFLQVGLVVALVFLSQSRRFARPVPEREKSRLSKLEYVSAMAELQQRTRAYDLAIENIYADFRRRVCTLLGLDNTVAKIDEIAVRISDRIGGDARQVRSLLFECEDVIHGEPIGRRHTVALVERLRRLESQLGLKRASRGVQR